MLTWFTENPIPLYVILGIIGIISLLAFYSTGRRGCWVGVGAAVVLIGLAWLTDYLVVTDREMIEESTYAMIESIEKGEMQRFDEYISRDFAIPEHQITREKLIASVRPFFTPSSQRRVRAHQLEVLPSDKPGEYVCDSMVQVSGRFEKIGEASGEMVRLKLAYQKDADGRWRIRHYEVYWFNDRIIVPP
jgi:hypothetical protein